VQCGAAQRLQLHQQVPGIMGIPVQAGKFAAQPIGMQVDAQREDVQIGKQGLDEGRKGSEGAPVAPGAGSEETKGKPQDAEQRFRPSSFGC
jgi:hypothetical protein